MNNENTQLLTLDDHVLPCTEVQRFVDGLVDTYEQRILKANVVQLDHTSRAYAPVIDLDAHDGKLTEEDVLTARIFPKQDTERMREALVKELDSAVENYANAIIRHSKTVYALSIRLFFALRAVTRVVYTRLYAYGTDVYHAWLAHQSERREFAALRAEVLKEEVQRARQHTDGGALADVQVGTQGILYREVPVTHDVPTLLTYTYEAPRARSLDDGVSYPNSTSIERAMRTEQIPCEKTVTEPLRWEHVARCLYLQFRYDPTDIRSRPASRD